MTNWSTSSIKTPSLARNLKNLSKFSLSKEIESNDRKKYKTMSKRRYYQSLTKSVSNEIINKNNLKCPSFNNDINISIDKDVRTKSSVSFNKTNFNFDKKDDKISYSLTKEQNIINTKADTNDKTNNLKDNESQDNIIIQDFENEDNEIKIISESKINSIIDKEKENPDITSITFESLISNSNIPTLDSNKYVYKDAIGEGSFGTIFEVEEKDSGKKYAIKKIICRDLQQLIKQKQQLEFAYSIQHENIMKIYKAQINCLDFSTYSINILMELAISDWNQEIKKEL